MTNIYLTDEASEISGYKKARLSVRSSCPSLVRSAVAGSWITEPLSAVTLSAAAWTLHLWASGTGSVQTEVYQFTNTEAATALVDNTTSVAAATKDLTATTVAATETALVAGNRLVVKVTPTDATVGYNGQYSRAEGDSYIVCPDTLSESAETPTATITQVRRHLKDTDTSNPLLSDDEVGQAVKLALWQYSTDRPLEVTDYISGDGTTYDFALPGRWVWGFSNVLDIEYPVGEQVRTVLEGGDYEVIQRNLGTQPVRYLRFLSTPESGTDNILVRYTTRHTHTDETDTVPVSDFDALTWLAASYGAVTLSAKMSASSDSTIGADAVNYRDGQLRWKQTAEAFAKLYQEYVHGSKDSTGPAGRVVDWDTNMSWGGDRLFHGRRSR